MKPGPGSGGIERPLALLAIAFFVWVAFQTYQLVRESQTLANISQNQDAPLENAARLRQATDALAGETATLAQKGNEGAKQVVQELARQNVRVKPPAGAGGPPPTLNTEK